MNAIRIESTNRCNLRCRMCPQSDKRPGVVRGLMDYSLFQTIVSQLAAFPETLEALFYLHICGEPLLHPRIVEFVECAASRGFKPILTTNAALLTAELAERLIRCGLHKIEFSFEGLDKATYEAIRIGAKFEVVSSRIAGFLDLNHAAGHPVRTELVVVDLPQLAPERLRSFCDQMKARFDNVLLSGYFDWLGRVAPARYEKREYAGCSVLDMDLNVLWDGRVVPCCQDVDGAMVVGDFRQQCFLEILKTKQRHALRARLQSGHLAGLPCERCPVPWSGRQTRSAEPQPRAAEPALVAGSA